MIDPGGARQPPPLLGSSFSVAAWILAALLVVAAVDRCGLSLRLAARIVIDQTAADSTRARP